MTPARPSRLVRRAAVAAATLLGAVSAVQVALAAGAPWGEHVYGGRAAVTHGVLDAPYRASSAVAAVVLAGVSLTILARAGVVGPGRVPPRVLGVATWVVVAWLVLNTAGNLASTSSVERWGLGGVTAVAAILTAVVARSPLPTRQETVGRRPTPLRS